LKFLLISKKPLRFTSRIASTSGIDDIVYEKSRLRIISS